MFVLFVNNKAGDFAVKLAERYSNRETAEAVAKMFSDNLETRIEVWLNGKFVSSFG